MAFALSVFVADLGALGRALAVWVWRRFYDAGPFNMPLMAMFFVSVAIFVLGTLCKIRALTEPIYGFRPWFMAVRAVGVFVVVSIATK